MSIDTGGAAFGHAAETLRDWFAGMAMQAMVSCYCDKLCTDGNEEGDRKHYGSVGRGLLIDHNGVTGEYDGANEVAGDAYIIADAMIAEKRRTRGHAMSKPERRFDWPNYIPTTEGWTTTGLTTPEEIDAEIRRTQDRLDQLMAMQANLPHDTGGGQMATEPHGEQR